VDTHPTTATAVQLPLLLIVESDDLALRRQEDVLWFRVLRDLDWRALVPVAVQYYEALWAFNEAQVRTRRAKRNGASPPSNPETREQATLRLIAERPTFDCGAKLAHETPPVERLPFHVNPAVLRPGVVPLRVAGRKPKDFFALFKAFVAMPLFGRAAEPENVYAELVNNPSFARTCGFTQPEPERGYCHTDIPGLRKLQQFDQIMAKEGLWRRAATEQVRKNLAAGHVKLEKELVHDTTGYPGWSARRDVPLPDDLAQKKRRGRKKPKKQSQPRTTKECQCAEREGCSHPWVSADPGAGVIVKTGGKKLWGHKGSTIGFPRQEILLDVLAITDGAAHDSRCLEPHLERMREIHPDVMRQVKTVLDDGALDAAELRTRLRDECDIELVTPKNPRSWREIRDGLPNGIERVKSSGVPVCAADFPFDFKGRRVSEERFLFTAPDGPDGLPVCQGCEMREVCLTRDGTRRHISLPWSRLGMIDPKAPHLSQRYQQKLARRPAIERIHKLMKFDYGSERLTRRGSVAFQATLDKLLLAMHLAIAFT
jgi:hypothetical protein